VQCNTYEGVVWETVEQRGFSDHLVDRVLDRWGSSVGDRVEVESCALDEHTEQNKRGLQKMVTPFENCSTYFLAELYNQQSLPKVMGRLTKDRRNGIDPTWQRRTCEFRPS
jgi:hypothetical protein